MKLVILLAFVAVAAARPEDDYSRYENFDIDEVANNKRLLLAFCDCFTGTEKCTPEASDFKKWIPEALEEGCKKCSEKQRPHIAKIIIIIQEQLPEEFEKLKKLYNPEGKYDTILEEFLKRYGH